MNYHNFAQKTNWIAGSDQFENVPFFLTSVNIPGFNLNHPEIGGRSSTKMFLPADNIDFNSLSFDMLIDEDFEIYRELISAVNKGINVNSGNFGTFSFNFWIQLNNSKGNKVLKLEFNNCRIQSFGDINLDTQDEETEHTMSVELVYDFYEIENVPTLTINS